jgi:DNA-binding MarR family transcriptional regulator
MKDILLASSLRSVVSLMHKRLRKQVNTPVSYSMSEALTLSHLCNSESLSPSELAGLIWVKTQSMSEVLAHLLEQNLVTKTQSQTDKRKFEVSITEEGRRVVDQSRYERDEWLSNAIENKLTATEKKTLADAIKLMEKLNEY